MMMVPDPSPPLQPLTILSTTVFRLDEIERPRTKRPLDGYRSRSACLCLPGFFWYLEPYLSCPRKYNNVEAHPFICSIVALFQRLLPPFHLFHHPLRPSRATTQSSPAAVLDQSCCRRMPPLLPPPLLQTLVMWMQLLLLNLGCRRTERYKGHQTAALTVAWQNWKNRVEEG